MGGGVGELDVDSCSVYWRDRVIQLHNRGRSVGRRTERLKTKLVLCVRDTHPASSELGRVRQPPTPTAPGGCMHWSPAVDTGHWALDIGQVDSDFRTKRVRRSSK